MWFSLVLIHSDEKERFTGEIPNFFSWQTCMRSVYLSDERLLTKDYLSLVPKSYKLYRGLDAYSFLTEIVSGFHSKLFGESEVQAQFTSTFSKEHLLEGSTSKYFLKLRDQILEHSKLVRSKFLTGIGKQTYGSLCEKYIRNEKRIHLFGTGNLAETLLPYLTTNSRKVTLYGRDEFRLGELRDKFMIQTGNWSDYTPDTSPVIIASSYYPTDQLNLHKDSRAVLDFRNDTEKNFIPQIPHYIPFSELLKNIENTELKILELRPKVKNYIRSLALSREEEQIHIIHGWEDLPLACY